MAYFSNAPIKIKLFLLIGMSILLLSVTSFFFVAISSYYNTTSMVQHETEALAEVTSLAVMPALIFESNEDAENLLSALRAHKNIVYAAIVNSSTNKIFSKFHPLSNGLVIINEDELISSKCPKSKFTLKNYYFCKLLTIDGTKFGKLILVYNLNSIYHQMIRDWAYELLGFFLSSLLVLVFTFIFSKKLSEPILDLVQLAEESGKSFDYDARSTIKTKDEIGVLAASFNEMLDNIELSRKLLKAQKNHLEEQVAERTRDLMDAKNTAMVLADQAQSANKAKSDFLSIMSHEIRTPLNVVLGYTELLEESLLSEEQNYYVKTITVAGNSLLSLVNDILDFSKIEAGKMEKNEQIFDFFDLVLDAVHIARNFVKEKLVSVNYEIDNCIPRYLIGDDNRIIQILNNLLSNASKFTLTGFIGINVYCQDVQGNSGTLCLEVTDTGIGIPENKVKTIFSPFTQIDTSDTRRYEGSGLGLAIVKNLVELLGGEILVESELNKGTKFTLKLPLIVADTSTKKLFNMPKIALFDLTPSSEFAHQLKALQIDFNFFGKANEDKVDQIPSYMNEYELLIFSDLRLKEAITFTLDVDISAPVVVFLSSESQEPFADKDVRCDLNHITSWSNKIQLLDQINSFLHNSSEQQMTSEPQLTSPDSLVNDSKQILVVEDNPVNLQLIMKILIQLGFTAKAARNGLDALTQVKTSRVDLILMDCQMPKMGGIDATKHIRKFEKSNNQPNVPIIGLSANAFQENKDLCLKSGMDGFLSKPFTKQQLLDVLLSFFNSQKI